MGMRRVEIVWVGNKGKGVGWCSGCVKRSVFRDSVVALV